MAIRVGVLFGGRSVEHEVSIISALQAMNALDRAQYEAVPLYITREGELYAGEHLGKIEEYRDIPALLRKSQQVFFHRNKGRCALLKYPLKRFGDPVYGVIDVAFPIVHGTNVEDGTLQGYLKMLSVPFVGCDVTASALGMDKYATKAVLRESGIPVLPGRKVYVKDYFADPDGVTRVLAGEMEFPLIVKPLNLGSSVGIRKAADADGLREALEYAFQYANTAIVERAIVHLREINCAVLGDQESVKASECEEPINSDEILSYEDKYIAGDKSGAKGMSGAKRILPAELPEDVRERIRALAMKTFQALGCNGVARVDFLLDGATGDIFVNEINTIPGSLSFYLWRPVGLTYPELLGEMIDLAFKRQREESAISYSFETGILSQFQGGLKGGKL